MPVSVGRARNNWVNASRPPAEAPIPTTVHVVEFVEAERSSRTASVLPLVSGGEEESIFELGTSSLASGFRLVHAGDVSTEKSPLSRRPNVSLFDRV